MGDDPEARLVEAARAYRAAFELLQVALAVAADQPGAGLGAWVAEARDALDAAQARLFAAALALEGGSQPSSPAGDSADWLANSLTTPRLNAGRPGGPLMARGAAVGSVIGLPAAAATTQIVPSVDGRPAPRADCSALLAELDALIDRLAAALGRLRHVRAALVGQLEVGDARIDLAALQRLAEETNRLSEASDEAAAEAAALTKRSRP